MEQVPGRCSPRRGPSWRPFPTPACSPSSSSARSESFARKPREGQLTERELGVLRLLDSEFTSRQMAESLYVAPSTVRTQIKSLYRKLGVSSRGAAVAEAHARGLVQPSPRVNPLGEMRWWVMTDRPAVNYARRPEGYEERR
jgi:DNA-binding CsgD family transcriptional regulator